MWLRYWGAGLSNHVAQVRERWCMQGNHGLALLVTHQSYYSQYLA